MKSKLILLASFILLVVSQYFHSNTRILTAQSHDTSITAFSIYLPLVINISESTLPAAITDLAAIPGSNSGEVALSWTAVGPYGNTTTATSYLVRYSTSLIMDESSWALATPVTDGVPVPAVTGTPQTMTISGLPPDTIYFFGIRATDEKNRKGALSNTSFTNVKWNVNPFIVDNTASLITAINQANSNGSGLDIIDMQTGDYTITASIDGENGLPIITSAIVIEGNGKTIQRDNTAAAFRLFKVGSAGDLTLKNLTLTGGIGQFDGGAIYNDGGRLFISACTISNNTSPLDPNPPQPGPYSARGGGIYSQSGQVVIVESTITNNSAVRVGGGIFINQDELTIYHTTISNNTTVMSDGSAIRAGFQSSTSTVIIRNSTISNNISGTGSTIDAQNLDIQESTLVRNISPSNASAIKALDSLYATNNLFQENDGGIETTNFPINLPAATVTNNCFMGNYPNNSNGYIVRNNSSTSPMNAVNNYWGRIDGPSGAGSGHGDPVSTNINFTPFLPSPPAFCPSVPVAKSVVAGGQGPQYPGVNPTSLLLYYIAPNAYMPLIATVYGYNNFDPDAVWSILSGGGNLSSNKGSTVTFNAPNTIGEITTIRAASADNPAVYMDFAVRVASVTMFVPRKVATVLAGDHVPFETYTDVDGYRIFDHINAIWIVINGGGSFSYEQRPEYNQPFYVTYNAPASPGLTTVRVASAADPSQEMDIPITIVAAGPHTCSNVVLPSGDVNFTTGGYSQGNWPYFSNGTLGNYDPLIGQTLSLTINAGVMNPATVPIDTVTVQEITDNGRSVPQYLSLISGTLTNGTWYGEWIASDTHCNTYDLEIIATNAVHQSLVGLTLR